MPGAAPRRRVLVTGASGDLGQAVVARFLGEGANVAAQYLRRDGELRRLAGANGGELHLICADLGTIAGAQALAQALPPGWEGLDVLVNCVGGARPLAFEDVTAEEWEACLSLNLTAPFAVLQATLPLLRHARGSVVNLASVAALTGGAFGPHYAATKAGVLGLTRSAARALGPDGIRVNAVAPGPVASRMTSALPDEALAGILASTALGRVVSPDEVADAIAWLTSGSSAVTGQTVVVDGGRVLL
jgi:3-oxoacyl-[acyl-carrier protein] reductase